MFDACSSEENCAIWPMKSWSCIGLMGSWCCSCVIIRFRKSSLPRIDFGFVAAAAAVVVDGVVPPVPVTLVISVLLGEHVDLRPGEGQAAGRDDDLVGLVAVGVDAARGPGGSALAAAL